MLAIIPAVACTMCLHHVLHHVPPELADIPAMDPGVQPYCNFLEGAWMCRLAMAWQLQSSAPALHASAVQTSFVHLICDQ